MPVTTLPRVSGGAPEGSRVMSRIARPLNGLEIGEVIQLHVNRLAKEILLKAAIKERVAESLLSKLEESVVDRLTNHQRLRQVHLVYPKVGWQVKVRLERLDEAGMNYALNAECELDLDRNVRLILQFGESGQGDLVDSMEDERLSTDRPDEVREQFDLPIKIETMNPEGEVKSVDLKTLQQKDSGPKRAARTVDVGPAKTNSEAKVGEPVVLPSELPEVTLDLVPPEPEKPIPTGPAPEPGGMAKTSKPNARWSKRK